VILFDHWVSAVAHLYEVDELLSLLSAFYLCLKVENRLPGSQVPLGFDEFLNYCEDLQAYKALAYHLNGSTRPL